MSDLEGKVKRSIDIGNPRAAIALAVLGAVEPLARIAAATNRIAAVLEHADAEGAAAELRRLASLDGPFAFDHDAAVKLRARADELDGGEQS